MAFLVLSEGLTNLFAGTLINKIVVNYGLVPELFHSLISHMHKLMQAAFHFSLTGCSSNYSQ